MDSGDQQQQQQQQQDGADYAQLRHDYNAPETAHDEQRLHGLPVNGGGGRVAEEEWKESQVLPNGGDFEGQLRSMIMHHNTGTVESYESSPHPMTNTGSDNVGGNNPTSKQNGHGMPPPPPRHPPHPLHPRMEIPQPYPPHFLQGGYAPIPPMFMHAPPPPPPPPPGMYPPHMPLHPYPIPFDGQMAMLPPFPLPQFPPPGYAPMSPEQIPIAGYAEPMVYPDGQVHSPPSAPRQFDRNGPRHQRNHSYPKQHQRYYPRGQSDHFRPPHAPRQLPLLPQPGLINDDFPPLGTERPKAKTNIIIPVVSEPTNQQEGMSGSNRGLMSGPPSGPRYRGGHRNFGPQNLQYQLAQERQQQQQQQQQQPYQPPPQALAVLTEVATEQIALATPSAQELEHKTRLRERLQKLCTNVSPTAELKAFGSLVCRFP